MSLENLYPGLKTTADSSGVTQKSSLSPAKGKRRQAIMSAIKTVVANKQDGKGGKKAC